MINDSIPYFVAVGEESLCNSFLHNDFTDIDAPCWDMSVILMQTNVSGDTSLEISKDSFRHVGKPLPFSLENTDGIFVLFLVCFFFFGLILQGGSLSLKESFKQMFTFERNQRSFKQNTSNERWGSFFLVFQFVALAAICIYDILWTNNSVFNGISPPPFITIASFILLIIAFIFLKSALYNLIGFIFDFQREVESWIRVRVSGLELMGLAFFVPTLFLVYSDYWHQYAIGFMALVFVIFQLLFFYRLVIFFMRKKFSFLYLIAYLCSVEIIPIVFLALGLVYLYKVDVLNLL